jgi:quercetin dioxygenase-like cupin family protein
LLFLKGEEIGKHDSEGDALVQVIEGTGEIVIDDKSYILNAGETIIMPAKKPHSVYAKEDFKMVLTVVFGEK